MNAIIAPVFCAHYEEIKTNLMTIAAQRKVTGFDIVTGLDFENLETAQFRDWSTEAFKVSAKDISAALRCRRIEEVLGFVPSTPTDFVHDFLKRHRVNVTCNGIVSRDRGYLDMLDGSDRMPLTKADYDNEANKWAIDCFTKHDVPFTDLLAEMRQQSSDLTLGYGEQSIDDAFHLWVRDRQTVRKYKLIAQLLSGAPPEMKQARADFLDLCRDCFTEKPEFSAAVIQKFIHQVKRKARNLKIHDHLMPVLLGKQKSGKSTFLDELIRPLEELSAPVDFEMITDEKIIDIWASLILKCDEMGWASRSDVDTVKGIITAPTLRRRPMKSNKTIVVKQSSTLIGAANKESLKELIRDPTGIRRFVSLHTRARMPIKRILAFDWKALWQSVDHMAADPLEDFQDVLDARQEAERDRSNVEVWLESIEPKVWACGALVDRTSFTGSELYSRFRELEQDHFPKSTSTDVTAWGLEMTRLAGTPDVLFAKKRAASGVFYNWVGPKPGLHLVEEGAQAHPKVA